jgi:phosphocarrier protein FPr/phosphocarrier protein
VSDIVLRAPLSGWATALDDVDDEVFASRMLGDGVAIDPTDGSLLAPCDGEVIGLPASSHAVTLRADAGAELLLHVGIDTVALKGDGFTARVREGQRVAAGDVLLTFDLDKIARRARSAVTPVIVTEPDRFRVVERRSDRLLRAGDVLMTLRAVAAISGPSTAADDAITATLRIALPHGLHARPAALVARAVRGLLAEATLTLRDRSANAGSAVSLLSLGAQAGDLLLLRAAGPQATLVQREIEGALARAASIADSEAPVTEAGTSPVRAVGVAIASPGIAAGPLVHVARLGLQIAERGAGTDVERERLDAARARLAGRLRRQAAAHRGPAADILGAHLEFLDDPELLATAHRGIAAGESAGFAWRAAVAEALRKLESVSDARLRARADDLRDVESQLLEELAGNVGETRPLPPDSILAARDLMPSQLLAFDRSRIAAICTVNPATTSHVAILAASLGLPMLAGVDISLLDVAEGTLVVVDAERGRVAVAPDAAELAEYRARIADLEARTTRLRAAAALDCRTADGRRIGVWANVGSLAEAAAAVSAGAEGCGLLRTEFLFLDRAEPPAASEQLAFYQAIVQEMGDRPVVIRTLDAGSDKPIPFLAMPVQDNPALGLRGIRTGLWRIDILRAQLEAILAVRPPGRCRILLPMVNEAREIEAVRTLVREIARDTGADPDAPIGIMVETPAAAVNAARLAKHADFFSIGTNDLAQYVLAIDRGHPILSRSLDALHPAVLNLIGSVCSAARAASRPVAVCGGLASDPDAAALLIGLGVDELSAVPAAIPAIKEAVRRHSVTECRALAGLALDAPDAAAVRSLLGDRKGGGAE